MDNTVIFMHYKCLIVKLKFYVLNFVVAILAFTWKLESRPLVYITRRNISGVHMHVLYWQCQPAWIAS